jgi:ATP-binding cassette subfamily B protein
MEAMERLMSSRTTFIIAHRLSTLDNCDVRLELDLGRLMAARQSTTAARTGDAAFEGSKSGV